MARLAAGLVAEDYDILTAQDVLQAVEAFRRHAPDLVIVSLKLPGGGACACTTTSSGSARWRFR